MNYPLENRHESMRGYFNYYLFKEMEKNPDIYLLTGDLGHGMWDRHFEHFPDRTINVGAAEQCLLDMAVGLSLAGKIPVVYSITTFLLYRPFETLRTYIDREKIPMLLVGGGRDKDYSHDGYSHHSEDAGDILSNLKNIEECWPETPGEMESLTPNLIQTAKEVPIFVSLRR